MLEAQGTYDEALKLDQEDLRISKKALGDEHPSVATTLWNMGALFKSMGRLSDAAAHLENALSIFTSTVGPEHPSTKGVKEWLDGL